MTETLLNVSENVKNQSLVTNFLREKFFFDQLISRKSQNSLILVRNFLFKDEIMF